MVPSALPLFDRQKEACLPKVPLTYSEWDSALHLLTARTVPMQGDGLDAGDVTDLAESVAEKIDVLVNNAGMAASGDLQDSLLEGMPFYMTLSLSKHCTKGPRQSRKRLSLPPASPP